MRLSASHTPAPNVIHTPTRAATVQIKLKAGDMPIIRTSGNLEKWKKLQEKIVPFKSGKSGVLLLEEQRQERESRCT